MSYLEALKKRRKTPTAVWHVLRTSVSSGKFDFHVVFEGEEDEEFFSKFLTTRFDSKKYRPIVCDGKGGLLALNEKILEAHGELGKVFFFIDSDHDAFLGEDNYPPQTFSTCGYSVENYIYDRDVVMSGIKKHFQLNPSDDLCCEIKDLYEKEKKYFESKSRLIMDYAIALRIDNQNPILDNVDFNALFKQNEPRLTSKQIVCSDILDSAEVSALDIKTVRQSARQNRKIDPKVYFRGKLVAQFVLYFCRKLEKRFSDKSKLNGKPMRAKIDFSKRNLVSVFVDFVDAPPRMLTFFDEIDLAITSA